MHQPRKWWIGLPILAALVFFAAQSLTPQVEADLKSRLASRLSVNPDRVLVRGRDAIVLEPAEPARGGVSTALRDEPGLRRIAFAATTPSPSPPTSRREAYVFSATLGESLVALSGKLPNEDARREAMALAAAAGGGLAVSDGTTTDSGAPSGDYVKALRVALEALGSLAQGNVTLSGSALSIEGRGRANVRGETLSAKVKGELPQGFELVRAAVSRGPVSPYVFEASRAGAAVTLKGVVPDEVARTRLVESARRRFFDATVDDRLAIASGAPANFTEAAERALAELARLQEGALTFSDAAVSLSGAPRHDGARAEIAASLGERLPRNFQSNVTFSTPVAGAPLDADGCRAALAELSRKPVLFEMEDAAISDESQALLDGMTATILRCRTTPIEIAGHMDDQGAPEASRDRSKRRAQLVVEKFVKAGADPFHVWAAGYGGERPVAPNDTEENRARNRRIEFIVK